MDTSGIAFVNDLNNVACILQNFLILIDLQEPRQYYLINLKEASQ
jgi:hypothetical protein